MRLAFVDKRLAQADDPQLVVWLIGTHHGHGRHYTPITIQPKTRPMSARNRSPLGGRASTGHLFLRLKARYGVRELARMVAILRLADHRASEERRPS